MVRERGRAAAGGGGGGGSLPPPFPGAARAGSRWRRRCRGVPPPRLLLRARCVH